MQKVKGTIVATYTLFFLKNYSYKMKLLEFSIFVLFIYLFIYLNSNSFGRAAQLAGSKFPHQGFNPGPQQ